MQVYSTELADVKRVEPRVFADERGWFAESWRAERYHEHGIGPDFVQLNSSQSGRGVVRGLHYQWPEPQGKLVWVSAGRVFDVAVDIRPNSADFGRWTAVELDAKCQTQLWIPEGFAHGFQVLSETATFHYLCTRPYRGEFDAAIAWDDPDIGITWPQQAAGLSEKDRNAPRLAEMDRASLPS